MSFAQTSFLIATAAIAIPIAIHLLSRWQVRELELGTMRFLGEVVRDGAQRRKVRRWLLLMHPDGAGRIAGVFVCSSIFTQAYSAGWGSITGDIDRPIGQHGNAGQERAVDR